MKRIFFGLGFGLFLAIGMLMAKPSTAQFRVGVNINFQSFYDQLSPYGDWIDYPDYGYTWRPRVGSDFRPYSTNGYWAYTDDYDWMWNSGYDWGWAPFHYGRWFYDPYYGWLWVPGYDWSPAWVAWRGGGDYYGWAPLRPGFSISIGFGNYNPGYDYWTFAPCRYMSSRYIDRYYYPHGNNINIFNNTTIINNYYGNRGDRGYSGGGRYDARREGIYTNGPLRRDVEKYTGRINSLRVKDMDQPGRTNVRRNELSVYRPTVQRSDDNSSKKFAPRDVKTYDRSVAANRSEALRNGNDNGRVVGSRGNDAGGRSDVGRINNERRNNTVAERSGNVENRRFGNSDSRVENGNTENTGRQRSGNVLERTRPTTENNSNSEVRQRRSDDIRQQRQQNEDLERKNAEMHQQREKQINDQRNMDMRQQRERQMNEQRERPVNEQRNMEVRQQRERQMNEQRESQMRNQRERQVNEQRNMEVRQQRERKMNEQRESQMRSQRERQVNEQRNMEVRQQRESQIRSREMQPPQRESRSIESRSSERSAPAQRESSARERRF
ncbi:MAG: hypothetical protein IPH58_15775 [Sphingobacteriales bacterium]|nr:hypothetical protein [Sphingobacteriales bacterium]